MDGETAKRIYAVFMNATGQPGDRQAIRDRHLAFLAALEASGRLIAAGPLIDDETGERTGSGHLLITAASLAEAEATVAGDPFVAAGFRDARVVRWEPHEGSFDLAGAVRG